MQGIAAGPRDGVRTVIMGLDTMHDPDVTTPDLLGPLNDVADQAIDPTPVRLSAEEAVAITIGGG